ncbi:hypothetical protein Tco_0339966 [Tanacetum coccineum]
MPTDNKEAIYAMLLETWEVDNSKIIIWITNSVTPSIGLQLANYKTTKVVWDHLAKLYTQSNFAKQYQLETDIRTLPNDTSIQDLYSSMSALWDQLALTEPATLNRLRGSILHREPLYSVDSVVSELLAEEIRLKTLDDQKIVTQKGSSIFAASQRFSNDIIKKPVVDKCAYCRHGNLSVLLNQNHHNNINMFVHHEKQPPHLNNGVVAY